MHLAPKIYSAEPIPEKAQAEIDELLKSGDLFRYTSSTESPVAKLEREFADLMGVPFALSVNSCSSAMFLAMKALGIKNGDKVIIPAFTFAAVPSAIEHAGGVPVLVDIGDNYRLDMDAFEAALEDDIKMVIISHMRGQTSDMDRIVELCEARDIPMIEDAAHSLGTTWGDRKVGTIGTIGCFSFQTYKMVNGGEGGMMITDDPDIIARAVIMSGAYEHNWRKHPVAQERFEYWQNKLPLYNVRLNNLTAAVVLPQLEDVPRRVQTGLANYDFLAEILSSSDWFDVPEPLEKESRAPDSIQFNLTGFDDDEEVLAFQELAHDKGVAVQVIGLAKDNARAFWNWKFIGPQGDLSQTRAVLERACDVRLPIGLEEKDLTFIGTKLVEAAEELKSQELFNKKAS